MVPTTGLKESIDVAICPNSSLLHYLMCSTAYTQPIYSKTHLSSFKKFYRFFSVKSSSKY